MNTKQTQPQFSLGEKTIETFLNGLDRGFGQESVDAKNKIVRAVNSHDALVSALEEVCIAAQRQLEGHGKGIQPSVRLEAAFKSAQYALAKARGE